MLRTSQIWVAIYLCSIVLANMIIVWFGPGASIINAFVLIGLDLSLRDRLHDAWEGKQLWLKMFALICSGSVITILLNLEAMPIAIASAVAFGVSGLGDAFVYQFLRKYQYLLRVNGSNVVGSALDSLIFPTLAFGALMPEIVIGQFLAKIVGGGLWSVVLKRWRQPTESLQGE